MDEEQERAAFEAAWKTPLDGGCSYYAVYGVHSHQEVAWNIWKARAALSQPASEPVAWRCPSWGADRWAYFDGDDKPETVSPQQLEPLYASQPASDEAANIMELAHCFMTKPEGPSIYDYVEDRLKAYVNRVDRLTANGAEAWKDVPRTGDWVADLK